MKKKWNSNSREKPKEKLKESKRNARKKQKAIRSAGKTGSI